RCDTRHFFRGGESFCCFEFRETFVSRKKIRWLRNQRHSRG
ncbi:hypothetical protein TNCT_351861, partial [Trichonephila clavata]